MKTQCVFILIVLFVLFWLPSMCWGGERVDVFPICGVMSSRGYRVPEAKRKFGAAAMNAILVVPSSQKSPFVKRYQLVDRHHLPGFLAAYANWWVCVGKGRIIQETSASEALNSPNDYGILAVEDFSVDMSNGERGVE